MPVTHSSDRFTVTGGRIQGDCNAGSTSNTLELGTSDCYDSGGSPFTLRSGITDPLLNFSDTALIGRGVWIYSGTGAGQAREIAGKTDSNTLEIFGSWETIPDATSQYMIWWNEIDLQSTNSNMSVLVTGESQSSDLTPVGRVARCTSHINVGNGSTRSYFGMAKGVLIISEPASTQTNNKSIRIRTGNARCQFGHYDPASGIASDGVCLINDQIEGAFNREVIHSDSSSNNFLAFYACRMSGIAQKDSSVSNRGNFAIEFNGPGAVIDCQLSDTGQVRPFNVNIEFVRNSYFGFGYTMGAFTNPDTDTRSVQYTGVPFAASTSLVPPQVARYIRPRPVVPEFSPLTAGNDGIGTREVGAKNGNIFQWINPIYNRWVGGANPPSGSFNNDGHGGSSTDYQTTFEERYTFNSNVKDSSNVNLVGALVALLPTAGNINIDTSVLIRTSRVGAIITGGLKYVDVTDSNGNITEQEVLTGYWDERSVLRNQGEALSQSLDAYEGQTSGGFGTGGRWGIKRMVDNRPVIAEDSKFAFKVRVRLPDKLHSESPISFADTVTAGGVPVNFNSALIDDANYTADGSLVTGVSMTDDRSAPVSWQSKNWGLTIVGNLTTNPSLTIQDIYNWWKYHSAQDANMPGTTDEAWEFHTLMNSLTTTQRGAYYNPDDASYNVSGSDPDILVTIDDATTEQYGVRIVDENGDPFPGVVQMQADDGTYYTPPVTYSLTFTGLQANTEVRIYTNGTTTELDGVESISGSWPFTHNGSGSIDYVIFNREYQPIRVTNFPLSASNSSIPIQQVFDRNYENP